MLAAIFVAFVLTCTSYAAYLDLKTSEVPDAVSLLVGGAAVLYYLYSSLSAPLLAVSVPELFLLLAAFAYAAAVAVFLRLYRPGIKLLRDHGATWIGQWAPGRAWIGPVNRADVAGFAFLAVSGAAAYMSYLEAGMTPVVLSLLSGTGLFVLGWAMYLAGMWGGADAFVLGAVGYAFPYIPISTDASGAVMPVPFSLLMLVFTVGSLYSILYAVIVALREEDVMARFWQRLVEQRRRFGLLLAGYLGIALVLGQGLAVTQNVPLLAVLQNATVFLAVLAAFLVLYQFLVTVEEDLMRRTIPVDELEPGDVLANELPEVEKAAGERIVGLTPEQVDSIRANYDTVDIRTGVRFIVAFPIAIVLLIMVGDPVAALAGIL
jgi:hypothetical protein